MRVFGYTLLFCSMAAVLVFTAMQISNYLDPVYPEEKLRIEQALAHAGQIEAITAGNSLNRSIDFRLFGLRGYHLWEGGSDIFEVDYRLRAMVPLLPKLKVVFMPIGSNFFYHENAYMKYGDGRRQIYYAVTPTIRSFLPINGDLKNLAIGKLADIIRADHWQGVFEAITTMQHRGEGDKLVLDLFGIAYDAHFTQAVDRREVKRAVRRILESQQVQIMAVLQKSPQITEKTYGSVSDLAAYLHARDIRLILYTPPLTRIFNQRIRQTDLFVEMIETSGQLLQRLQRESEIEYHDFSTDEAFDRNYRFFSDADHLNVEGAKVFSKKFFATCGLPVVQADSLLAN